MKEGQGCGCRGWQRVREARTTHGLGKHPLYGLWLQVLYRCEKTTHVAYHHYGGRGIRVCEGWHDIKNFIQDNAERPSRKYTLDRIDNNGHYSCGKCSECLQNEWPANCQWSTKQVQNNHTRQNRMITINNRTQSMADWARENGLKYRTVRGRIERGWDDIEAVSVPLQRGGRRPVI